MNAPQGSEAWMMERCGHATASEFSSILAKGEGKMRTKYLRRVVAERLTGKPSENSSYGGWQKNLERGQEQEPFARMAYEAVTGNLVEEVGFIKHATLMSGCSPDGLISTDGGCEIKSVIPTVQLDTILAGGYPSEHRAQIQGNMWITGRAWWDFCSYSPDMPEHLRTYIFRVVRDEAYIKTLAAEVVVFLAEIDELVAKLNQRRAA
ncbi:MAG: YqaJ viral recombinase family protein [Gallionella sp.]|nr:YqaJ viral recombinase family protein [Gallionella sp.]